MLIKLEIPVLDGWTEEDQICICPVIGYRRSAYSEEWHLNPVAISTAGREDCQEAVLYRLSDGRFMLSITSDSTAEVEVRVELNAYFPEIER